MRKELQNIEGVRQRFIATFERYGKKSAYKGPPITTLLFKNIRDVNGAQFSDHVWFTTNKQFEKLDLQEGDNICFDARVKPYWKGYKGRREDDFSKPVTKDYKLSHPTNIVKSTFESEQGEMLKASLDRGFENMIFAGTPTQLTLL